MTSRPRTILHVDMDAFFVAVELLRRPELRGRPVVVGGAGERGVVAAASYEARRYGVHSAMPSVRARRLCPQAVFLPGDHARYAEVSQQVHAILRDVTPLVEGIALDEAFLDVTGALRRAGTGEEIAWALRRRVADELGLSCSVGVAPTKLVAKLASEAAKPRATAAGVEPGAGVVVVRDEDALGFLHAHPVQALWGVGPATFERLQRFGVRTVGDLAALDEEVLVGALGRAAGRHLSALARGHDDREVVPERDVKSVGHEETFPHDRHTHDELHADLVRLADGVAGRLRAAQRVARTVSIKVRFGSFRTISRSVTPPAPVATGPDVARAAAELLARVDVSPGVRLLGISASGLTAEPVQQLSFDDVDGEPADGATGSWDDASRAVDEIRARFGAAAIGPAALARPGGGVGVLQPGAQQWGPSGVARPPSAATERHRNRHEPDA